MICSATGDPGEVARLDMRMIKTFAAAWVPPTATAKGLTVNANNGDVVIFYTHPGLTRPN
jgi:hypothetical protein